MYSFLLRFAGCRAGERPEGKAEDEGEVKEDGKLVLFGYRKA